MNRMTIRLAAIVAALMLTTPAWAVGGDYEVVGGAPEHEATIRAALNASSYNWSRVPAHITIEVVPGLPNEGEAEPGVIRLRAEWLDWGIASWGTIQHEYAHQVDYFLLDDAKRAELTRFLGLTAWRDFATPHDDRAVERFASSLAWTFWPTTSNLMRPFAFIDRLAFKRKLHELGLSEPVVCTRIQVKRGYWHRHRVWRKAVPHWVVRRHWHKPVFHTTCS